MALGNDPLDGPNSSGYNGTSSVQSPSIGTPFTGGPSIDIYFPYGGSAAIQMTDGTIANMINMPAGFMFKIPAIQINSADVLLGIQIFTQGS